MSYVLSIELGEENYANPNEEISENAFGAEFLGWEFFSNFEKRHDQVDFHHIRWPGGIPIEDGINKDESEDGSKEVVYDLKFDNLVEWDRHNGAPREGIREVMDFAVQNDMSFALVVPTARYVEKILQDGLSEGLQAAREDIRYFVEKLLRGDFGKLPKDFTLEIGSEYYSTDVWKEQTTNEDGVPYAVTPDGIVKMFGDVFAAMVDEIDQVLQDPNLNSEKVDINIAVQLGRVGTDVSQNGGHFSDNIIFIESFLDVGALDAVDALIYHRYVPTFDNIGRGILWNANGNSLPEAIDLWEEAAGGKEFDLLAGYLAPAAQSTDKLEYNAPGLTNLLQMNAILLAEGMDTGSVYGLGHSTGGSLGWRGDVFLGGLLYKLMAESIPGKFVHDGFQDNTSNVVNLGESYVVSDSINLYVFENDYEVVVFLAAKDFQAETLEYTLSFDEYFSAGEITRLWNSGEFVQSIKNHEIVGYYGETSEEEAQLNDTSTGSEISITFNHDYEIIRLTLDKQLEGSEQLEGAAGGDKLLEGTSEDDEISGDDAAERIWGHDGEDVIEGLLGNDTINGNEGNDEVFGGLGDDKVKGGWGDDLVNGDEGNDLVLGDQGNDTLSGGSGSDTLTGGSGSDVFVFSNGDDTMTITDFEPGLDDLKLVNLPEGFTLADLVRFVSQDGDDVVIAARDQEVRFENTELSDLSADDVIFV